MRGFFRKALRETLRRLILREAQAPLSYITAGGDLHVTSDVMAQLGLPQGGGVVILDAEPGVVRMMSNETYLAQQREGEDPWL